MGRDLARSWIAGAWRASEGGARFEAGRLGRWPRADARDVADALAGIEAATPRWRAEDDEERADLCGELLDVWEDEGGPEEALARALGLDPDALAPTRAAALDLGDALIDRAHPLGDAAPVLARVAAGALGEGLVRALFPALLAGRGVLLLSDGEAPDLAHAFCRLLEEVRVPAGLVALLHDDTSTTARTALASGRLGRVVLVEPHERVERLARHVGEARTPAGAAAGFGAGVVAARAPELEAHVLRQRSLVVRRGDDPERAAAEVARDAFHPALALSGQRAGAVGRVLCHERAVSRFTEALLGELEALHGPPCALFDARAARHAEELLRLGLDEGATLVRGPGGASASSRARREGILSPSVFTNVEPRTALARADRPAPVLRLLRVQSDEEGDRLARAYEQDSDPDPGR